MKKCAEKIVESEQRRAGRAQIGQLVAAMEAE